MHSAITLDSLIGSGCFGTVHKGHDSVFTEIAVKVMEKQPGESAADWLARRTELHAEGQRLNQATHVNVVAVKYVVEAPTGDAIWLAMDFCNGGSLQGQYEAGPMKLTEVHRVINDVCNGLQAVHGRGMLHRDIKPGNILVHKNHFKIGDFGLVTDRLLFGYASGAGYITHLAPEVFADDLTSVPTDIWALGMTIYRLLHGKEFFDQHVGTLGKAEITSGGFANRLPFLSHIPPGWIKLIRKAMHDDPARRFSDPIAMAQAFAKAKVGLDWECVYTPPKTVWTAPKGKRRLVVTHDTLSVRRHQWTAVSLGKGKIKQINRGGSNGIVPCVKAYRGLAGFFKSAS